MLEAKGMELQAILSNLEETFPPVNPTPVDPLALVMYRAGQRSVVEYIQSQMEK
tara:strand:+ start:262 stop:423 length:162 start_codon:yes stop_codon:yes gene_type:complete